jgi:uncharacterized membrane protein YjjP (DUF1212 family)
MLRSALAVLVGYLLFAGSAVAFFAVSGRDPHARASLAFTVMTTLYGMFFAALGGYLTVSLSRRQKFEHAFEVAFLIAVSGAALILGRPGQGPDWSQLAALLTMAPMAMVGGYLRLRQLRASKASR